MKFMLSWRLHPDSRVDAMTGFSQMSAADDDADTGPEVSVTGRWHNVAEGTGVAICESDSVSAVYRWGLNWIPVLDLKIEPVLDDDETREVLRDAFSG